MVYSFGTEKFAGVAQLVEQLICNQQVGGSSPSTSSSNFQKLNMGEFPSGQRGQTVNLLLSASMVRIRPLPPKPTSFDLSVFLSIAKLWHNISALVISLIIWYNTNIQVKGGMA